MTAVLRRLGYVYKKPRLVLGKADASARETFIQKRDNLRRKSGEGDVILVMDATQPRHNSVISRGWIKRGMARSLKSKAIISDNARYYRSKAVTE